MKRLPIITLLLSACAVAIHASPALTAALQFDRAAVVRGEPWRVVTGHFTHFGADHLRWDVIAFLAFGSLAEVRSRGAFFLCLAFATFSVSLGVGVFQPQFSVYRGLSGLDSALFTFVTADLLRGGLRDRDRLTAIVGGLALAGFVAKSAFEFVSGQTLFVDASADFEAAPLAHLVGALVGAATAFTLNQSCPPQISADEKSRPCSSPRDLRQS